MIDFLQDGNKFTVRSEISNALSSKEILDVKVFVINTHFVGEKSYINQADWDPKKGVNAVWSEVKIVFMNLLLMVWFPVERLYACKCPGKR